MLFRNSKVVVGGFAVVVGVVVGVFMYSYITNTPHSLQEKVILSVLNDPESAQFGEGFQSKLDKNLWCGEVNARNRMGGMVGFTRYMVRLGPGITNETLKDRNTIELLQLSNDVRIEPHVASDDITSSYASFQSAWRLYCS